MGRLNDTEALVRKGMRPAHSCEAGYHVLPAMGSADLAVSGPRLGAFRRETGAGDESMRRAVEITNEK